MAENFLVGFLRAFETQDYGTIQEYLTIFLESSKISNFVTGSNSNMNWAPLIKKVSSQRASVIQQNFDCLYDVDDLLEDFLKNYIETGRKYFQGDISTALEKYIECLNDFLRLYKVFSMMYADEWLYLIFETFCQDVRNLAIEANLYKRKSGENKDYLSSALTAVMNIKQEFNRLKSNDALRHKIKLLCLLETHLAWINFKLNNYEAVRVGIRILSDLISKSNFSLSHLPNGIRVKLSYNWGKIALLTGRYLIAIEKFEDALKLCPTKDEKNVKLIIKYLSVVKVLNGQKISEKLMDKYGLKTYYQFEDKVARGDLQGYYWELHFRLLRWVKCGLTLLFDSFRFVIYRNILRKWHNITKASEISFSEMKKILELKNNARWHHEFTEDEIQAIFNNMVVNGYIKASVSVTEQKVRLSKLKPFPKLSEVNLHIQKSLQKATGESL